jgi:hypothetical protein
MCACYIIAVSDCEHFGRYHFQTSSTSLDDFTDYWMYHVWPHFHSGSNIRVERTIRHGRQLYRASLSSHCRRFFGWYISANSIMNTRHKRNKMIFIATFIALMVVIMCMLIALLAASIDFSTSFVGIPLTDSQRGNLACTGCELPEGYPL